MHWEEELTSQHGLNLEGGGLNQGKGSAFRQRESASKGDGVCMQGEGGLHPGGIGSASVGQWRGSASARGTIPSSRYI